MSSATESVIVVGAGQAAGQFAASLRGEGYQGRLVLIGEEPHIPYQRPPLSKHLLAGNVGVERAHVKPAGFYPDADIELLLERRVESIDREAKSLSLSDGETLSYDKLVLATGSRVRRLELPGADADNVHYLRTLNDMYAIRPQLVAGRRLVVVGGGYIGLEVAAVAVGKGVEVTVLEQAGRLMQRVVGPEVAEFYRQVHEAEGVTLHHGLQVSGFEGTPVSAVVCADGRRFDADLVVIGVGVRPNEELAEAAGLETDDGVVVDDYGITSDIDILAIGDCTRFLCARYDRRVRLESVPNALGQARAAASAVAGNLKPYHEVPWFWSDQYRYKLQIVGFSDGHDQVLSRGDPSAGKFMRCYLQDGELLAVEAVNSPKEFMACRKLVAERASMDPVRLADGAIPVEQSRV